MAATADAESWVAEPLLLPAPVTALRHSGAAVYVNAAGWRVVSSCKDGRLCTASAAPLAPGVAVDGIPDGAIAAAGGRGVVRAWFAEPTARYRHGVLGDAIEGGALVALDDTGRRYVVRLDKTDVFEDLTPRIADIDDDGQNDVAVIRSGLTTGAAVVVYGLRDGQLVELAANQPIGRPNRWLNIAGIGDFSGDGRPDIAIVKTPHIGGLLEILTMRAGTLDSQAEAGGFSNHAIGSSELGLSAVADVDGDGLTDLAIPDASRRSLRLVSARGGRLAEIGSVPLGGSVATAIGVVETGLGPAFVVGLDNGRAVVVRRQHR